MAAKQRIDLNTAPLEELMRIEGIDETRARRLVDHRQKHGPFHRLEDVEQVEGFGPTLSAKVRQMAKVGRATGRRRGDGQEKNLDLLATLHAKYQLEAELGHLAAKQAASEPVRECGRVVAEKNEVLDRKLVEVARARGLDLEQKTPGREREFEAKRALEEKLRAQQGEALDRACMKLFVQDHRTAVRKLEQARERIDDDRFVNLFSEAIPQVRALLQEAERVQRQLGR